LIDRRLGLFVCLFVYLLAFMLPCFVDFNWSS
jgi:hypothetical protein